MTDKPVWIIEPKESGTGAAKQPVEDHSGNTPSLLSVADQPVVRTAGSDAGDKPAPAVQTAGRDPQQFLDEIKQQKATLASLYDTNGNLVDKTYKVEGHEVPAAAYRDYLVTKISTNYQGAIDAAKANQYAGNDARLANTQASAVQLMQQLKDQYGIELPTGYGGKLTTYTVEQQMAATTNPGAKQVLQQLHDAITGHTDAARNQNMPDHTTMEYADFLRSVGLTKQADNLLKGIDTNTVTRNSMQYEQLSDQIKNDFANQREQLVPKDQDPLVTLDDAVKKLQAGDTAGAEAAFAKAYQQYDQLPKDKIQAEIKRLTDAQDAIDKQVKEMSDAGTLYPPQAAAFEQQKNQLTVIQANWEQLKASKQTIELEHAHYLLNQSPNKGTIETRHKALEMLDDVRYSENGKIAMMFEFSMRGEQRFSQDLMLAAEGKPQSAQAMQQWGGSMAEAAKLLQEADALKDKDEKAASIKYQQARMNAENALGFAEHIDVNEAKYTEEQTKKNIQRIRDEEKAKPAGERNEQKIALLDHMLKPKKDQDPATMALLDNLLQPAEKIDQAKLKQLKDILKDDYSMMEVAQLHATLADSQAREFAANSARMLMLQVDCNTGKAENNPLTKEIEDHDPDGSFRAQMDWGQVKEATRDIAWYEHLWNGIKDIGIGIISGLVAVGTFVVVTGASVGWGAPAGVALGLAAGTATYTALHAAAGDKITWWTPVEGVVTSAAALATMGTGSAIAGSFGKSAVGRIGTYFVAGMAGDATYNFGMGGVRYGQGVYADFGTAMKSSALQTAADAPMVLLTAGIAGKVGAKPYQSQFASQLGLDVNPSVARQVFSQWGALSVAYLPAVAPKFKTDAQLDRMIDARNQRNQPK
ncbi:MAG: hypothetical protein U0105_06395 [Candidatus Obscuribacterales bacterium]